MTIFGELINLQLNSNSILHPDLNCIFNLLFCQRSLNSSKQILAVMNSFLFSLTVPDTMLEERENPGNCNSLISYFSFFYETVDVQG